MGYKLTSILGVKFFHILLRLFFCLTCQYIPPVRSKRCRKNGKCWSSIVIMYAIVCTTIFGIAVNLYPTIIFVLDCSICPIRYSGFWDILTFHSNGNETG